jgi:pimeloyl-ACP methyl ester carboxylesterase
MRSETIAGPAGSLHVDDGGVGGVPVVFVHSFAGSTEHWAAQLAHLRPTRRAVALDLRSHGRSQVPPDGDHSVAALVGDVMTVVDALDIERFALVGHSLGGSVAIGCAAAEPERVAGLLLVGTPGKSAVEQAEQVLSAMEADYDKVTENYWNQLLENAQPNVRARVRSDMRAMPRETALGIIRAIFEFDPLPALRSFPGPVWIVTTQRDDSPSALHRQLPDVPHRLIGGTSHWLQMDKPVEFNRILDDFVALVR